ncbi:hypothetical protein ACRRTK_014427 [Alexandromys fortis]
MRDSYDQILQPSIIGRKHHGSSLCVGEMVTTRMAFLSGPCREELKEAVRRLGFGSAGQTPMISGTEGNNRISKKSQ